MPPGVPPLLLFTTLARDERLLKKLFAGSLLGPGHLSLREREIVIDRTTALCRCEYEWGVHASFFAAHAGLDSPQLHSLVHGQAEDPCWGARDRILIRMCDELHRDCSLGDAAWSELRMEFSDEAILELLMLAGYYRTISYLANALALPLESFGAPFPPR